MLDYVILETENNCILSSVHLKYQNICNYKMFIVSMQMNYSLEFERSLSGVDLCLVKKKIEMLNYKQ